MFYGKKIVSIVCLSLCFSLHADDCNTSNVQKKADDLKASAAVLKTNATTLQKNAIALKSNVNQLKSDATTLKANVANLKNKKIIPLEQDFNKLMILSNNSDLLDDAIANLPTAPKK